MAVIRVHTSNGLGELVAVLAEVLPRPGPGPGLDALFEGPWLVVPGRPIETFVDLELARRRNISGGITTLTLRGAIARLCATAAPDIVLVERAHLVGELLAVLEQQDRDGAEDEGGDAPRDGARDEAGSSAAALQPLERYVRAAGDAAPARERRRLQLAGELAQLFDDWSQTRPELLAAWRTGKPVSAEGEPAPLEAAERELWRRLFAPGGRFERRGAIESRRFLTVDGVLSTLLRLEQEGALDASRMPSQIHVFEVSAIPRAYFPLLEWLGQRTGVHVYALNPCREFWEDLDTAKAARWRATHPRSPEAAPRQRGAGSRAGRRGADIRQLELGGLGQPPPGREIAGGNDNPLLTLWGRVARDNLRLLGQLTDGDFDARFIDRVRPEPEPGPGRASLLARLQQDLLEGKAAHASARAAGPDASIRILGAPDPRREWESIAAEIWALMRADPTLRFCDIAVRVAGPDGVNDSAFSLAAAVFQEASDLPWTWVDPSLATASHLGEAFLQAMELFDGNFTRREVLDVITHPNIRGRFADSLTDASSAGSSDVWVELCEGLGVAQGADRAAFAGTYVNADVFNWDQAIRRLALGVFAAGPRSGFETPLTGSAAFGSASQAKPQPQPRSDDRTDSAVVHAYVPAEVPSALRDAADGLGLLLRSLIGDADFARQARMTLPEWVDFGRAVLDCYTCALSAADEDARARILGALDELGARVGAAVCLPLHVAVTLMRDTLSSLRASSGQILGAGVVVGSLRALRSLPFRVVFVAGLGGNEFPATESRSVFDPLAVPPRTAFPVGPTARERDQDLFLDAVMAAGETLVLTCVDRNPFTGEPRVPSSVVVQLTDVLRQHYLAPEGPEDSSERPWMRSAPLHRDEDGAVRNAFPAAMAEAVARDVGAAIRLQIPQAARLSGDALTRALSVQTRATLAPLLCTLDSLGAPAAVALGPAGHDGPIVIRLAELVRFLECPLQGSARFLLRLRDVQDDAEARDLENEPLESPRGLEMRLCTEAFLAAFSRQNPPTSVAFEAAYDELSARQRFSAPAPTGRFREHARTRDLVRMNRWWEQLCVPALGVSGPPARICFGRPDLLKPATEWRPAIRLTLPPCADGAGARSTETVVELHGTTSAMVRLESGRGGWLLPNRGKFSDLPYCRHRVLGFIDTLAYVAAGGSMPLATGEETSPWTTTPQNLHLWGEGKTPRHEPALAEVVGRAAALSYLTSLAAELLAGVSTILFPCEAVFSAERSELSISEQIAFMRGDVFYRPRLSTSWGPVPDPFEYPIPDVVAARELRRRRFGLLLGPERVLAAAAAESREDATGQVTGDDP